MNYGDNPDHVLGENGEDDNALEEGNDRDGHYHDGSEEEEGGEGSRNGEDEEGGGKRYTKGKKETRKNN
jgi:hypothetical protein